MLQHILTGEYPVENGEWGSDIDAEEQVGRLAGRQGGMLLLQYDTRGAMSTLSYNTSSN